MLRFAATAMDRNEICSEAQALIRYAMHRKSLAVHRHRMAEQSEGDGRD
jgi:hypothetical protein